MNILVKTAGMSRDEWLKYRTMGIGGADVSVIAGINPFRSIIELWREKTGRDIPTDGENEYTHFGTVLEAVIKREFMNRTGLKVRAKNAILQSEEYPFMLANLDGVINENGETVIFEAKTASAYKIDQWEGGIPKEYMYQLQHYMAVTGYHKAYIAALVGGNRFIIHEVYEDKEMIRNIVEMEKEFWQKNVMEGIEPDADGSEATTDYLADIYSESNGKAIELPKEAVELCRQYDELSSELDNLKMMKSEAENRLKTMLGNNETGIVEDRTIRWKQISQTRLDSKLLKQEQADLYEKYAKTTSYRRFEVA